MKMKHAAVVGLAAVASLSCVPLATATNAHGPGLSVHPIHFSNHFRPARHRNAFNQSAFGGLYGGYYALPSYTYGNMDGYPADAYSATPTVVFVAEPPRALSCQYSQQIKTVPAEGGGTRDITITRC